MRKPEPTTLAARGVRLEPMTTGHAAGLTTGSDIWSIAVPLPAPVLGGRAVLGIAGPREQLAARTEAYGSTLHAAVAQWLRVAVPGRESPA